MNILSSAKKLKAFTLAEILIVLTVIGVIATITLPQLTGGTDEAQFKAAYKKAYASLANIVAIEKADDNLPTTNDATALLDFFRAIDTNIEVDGYALATTYAVASSSKATAANIKQGLQWKDADKQFGDTADMLTNSAAPTAGTWSPWIIAADGMAFSVVTGGGCSTKSAINKSTATIANAIASACLVVAVDVNGLEKGPNKLEPQVTTAIGSTAKLKKLTGDRYYVFIANNGIAKGSELLTGSGRLLAGAK